jgi:hypothetical protein
MAQTIVRVRPTNGLWRVEHNGTVVKKMPIREEAIALGRELAHMHHGVLIGEDPAGRLVERDNYSS